MEQTLAIIRLVGYFVALASSAYSFFALRGTIMLGRRYPFMQSIAIISGTMMVWALLIAFLVLLSILKIEVSNVGGVIATIATVVIAGGMSVVAWNVRKKRLEFLFTMEGLDEEEIDDQITVRALLVDWKSILGIVAFAFISALGYYEFSVFLMDSYIASALVMSVVALFSYLAGRRK